MNRGLQPGKYSLRLADEPSPLVGVDLRGVDEQPVVTNGNFRIWIVEKEGDDYILSIEDSDGNWFAQANDKDVVGVKGAPARWIVVGPEGGPYTIRLPGPATVPFSWTVVNNNEHKALVVLRPLQLEGTPENQKWYFVGPQP